MASQKKATPRPAPKKAAKVVANKQTSTVDSPTVRLLIICFTILCVIFALAAFWRYD